VKATAAPPDRRYRLTLHYDGAEFHGWQTQPNARTVQGVLESALSGIISRRADVMAAGRTDAGVHATGQVASAIVPGHWRAEVLQRALNAVLPPDVWVASVDEVALDFHARYDAVARGYTYRVGTEPAARSPFLRRWCWPLGHALAPQLLAQAAGQLPGRHSFRAFARSGQPERGEFCTVWSAQWAPWSDLGWTLRITANRFLHHMVRYLVGTMIDVARNRRPVSDIDALLRNESGFETSAPAPAKGLFLTRVYYDTRELEVEGAEDRPAAASSRGSEDEGEPAPEHGPFPGIRDVFRTRSV
jgi:tRNA pseudouridine38-40 synthase